MAPETCFTTKTIPMLVCLVLLYKVESTVANTEHRTLQGYSKNVLEPMDGQSVRDTAGELITKKSETFSKRALLQRTRQSQPEVQFGCALSSHEVERFYDESSRQWLVNDDVLEEVDDDVQAIIECTKEDDVLVFQTNRIIKPKRTLILSTNLTLTNLSEDAIGNGDFTLVPQILRLTCPDSGQLLISKSPSLALANLVVEDCTSTTNVIELSPECVDEIVSGQIRLLNFTMKRNVLTGQGHLINAGSASCHQLEMTNVSLRSNHCNETHCILLSANNTLDNIQLLHNQSGNDTSLDLSIFSVPQSSRTMATHVRSEGNKIGGFNITNSALIIRDSRFEDNNVTSGGAIAFDSESLGYIDQCTFIRNMGYERAGGAIRALASNISISSSVFRENDAPHGGGSIYFRNWCNSTIINSTFENNTANFMGGAISAGTFSSIFLSNSSFQGNYASWGAALFSNHRCNISLSRVDCFNNKASSGGCFHFVTFSIATITSCRLYNNSATESGGAIELFFNAELFMHNSTIQGNSARTRGGGIEAQRGSTFQLTNATFATNKANSGGVLYVLDALTATVDNSIFANNTSFLNGGAIQLPENSSIVITNSTFSGNKAILGGGMYVENNSTAMMFFNFFSRNNASTSGGAIYVNASNIFVTSSQLESNSAKLGGSFFASNSSMEVTNSIIKGSHAQRQGGGIYMQATIASMKTTRLESNEALENGGGIALTNASSLLCSSCLIVNNRAFSGAGLYAFSNDSFPLVAQFQDSHFVKNSAYSYGGGIEFVEPQERDTNCTTPHVTCGRVILLNTSFVDNYANHSGAVLLTTDPNNVLVDCENKGGHDNEFLNETTVNLLKAIDPRQLCPSWVRNNVSSNVYGYAVGTYGQVMELLIDPHSDVKLVRDGTNRYVLENVSSGRQLPTINVTILDQYGQGPAPTLPYTFEARLLSEDGFFRGLHLRNITAGYGNFSEVAGFALPGSYTLNITSDNPSIARLSVTVIVRECHVGEEPTRDGLTCQECDDFSYNFNTSEVGGCKECPNDATCSGRYIVPNKGHWHKSPCRDTVQSCLVEEACTYEDRQEALINFTHNSTDCNINENTIESYNGVLCNEGYKGPLCGSCKKSYGLSFRFQCFSCPRRILSILTLLGLTLYLLVSSAITIRGTLPSPITKPKRSSTQSQSNSEPSTSSQDVGTCSETEDSVTQDSSEDEESGTNSRSIVIRSPYSKPMNRYELLRWKTTEILKILMNSLQTTAVAATVNVQWTEGVLEVFEASEYVGVLTTAASSGPIDCLISTKSPKTRSISTMLLTLLVPGIVIIIYLTIWSGLTYKRKQNMIYFCKRSLLSIIAVTYISYLGLTQLAVRAFYCVDVYDSVDPFIKIKNKYWAVDTAVTCYGNAHTRLIIVGVILLLFVSFGFPMISALVLTKSKAQGRQSRGWQLETMGFLYRAFKEEFVYWESVVMLRKALLSVIVVFSYPLGGQIQGLLAALVVVFALYFHQKHAPFRQEFDRLNYYESLSLLVSCVTFILGQFFNAEKSSNTTRILVAVVIIIANTSFFGFLVLALLANVIEQLRESLQTTNTNISQNAPWWKVVKVFITSKLYAMCCLKK